VESELQTACNFELLCPDAQQVFLVGDFNGWSTTATPMQPAADGHWHLTHALAPGHYRFSYFVIEKSWRDGRDAASTYLLPGSEVLIAVPESSRLTPSSRF
jgi:1,4-alpha-glucan branching enzyme